MEEKLLTRFSHAACAAFCCEASSRKRLSTQLLSISFLGNCVSLSLPPFRSDHLIFLPNVELTGS
jgi:hypothetical protein